MPPHRPLPQSSDIHFDPMPPLYIYIYRYRKSGKHDFVDRNRGFVDRNRGFVEIYLFRACRQKVLLYLCNRELVKRYTRVAFHLGAAKAALLRIGVCSSVIVLFDFLGKV